MTRPAGDGEARAARALRVLNCPFTQVDGLTDLEVRVVNLAARGFKTREIAEGLATTHTRVRGVLARARHKTHLDRWDMTYTMVTRVESALRGEKIEEGV